MAKPYKQHLKSGKSLETTYEAVRAGFVALALEKNRRATPFVAQARALKAAAGKAKTPADLLKIAEIQLGLLTAAGVSDKATNHLEDSDKREAVSGLIKNFLEPAGVNFVEELVFRFLLTRGDTLGGSMRNVGGFMAQKKLTRAILACLKLAGQKCHSLHSETNAWAELKGGIDPAGADEHWKTARTALNRIHEAFAKQKLKPHTFFIGAAIETKMASEIWDMLKLGSLENAANLTDEDQISSISSWLCKL
jgi:hypothetical protein